MVEIFVPTFERAMVIVETETIADEAAILHQHFPRSPLRLHFLRELVLRFLMRSILHEAQSVDA